MRSSLVVSGGILLVTGIVLFVALAGEAWLALVAGGALLLVAGFLLNEVTDRLEPPQGFHFCLFCSTLVADGAERCSHCNGAPTDRRTGEPHAAPTKPLIRALLCPILSMPTRTKVSTEAVIAS